MAFITVGSNTAMASCSRCVPLPIAAPVPALRMVQRVGRHPLGLRPGVLAAHVLAPRHLAGMEAQVHAADLLVLAEVGSMPKVAKGEPSPGFTSPLSPRPG